MFSNAKQHKIWSKRKSNAKKIKSGSNVVGIDMGTTNTVVAGYTPDGTKIYKDGIAFNYLVFCPLFFV